MSHLESYIRRLQLPAAPGLDAAGLALLHERHMETVPFENFDVLAGRPISLATEDVLAKLLDRRRGGFCYELNSGFAWLLRELGFDVSFLAAEVWRASEETWGIPLGHMALLVRCEGKRYLCDVGFGDGPLTPLDLDERDEIHLRTQSFQFVEEDGLVVLQCYEREAMGYRPMYRFRLDAHEIDDFAEPCRFQSTDPSSHFLKRQICMIAAPDGRISLTADELVILRNRRREVTPVTSDEQRRAELRRYFGLSLD